ncbi:helix-turn-helix transcriptional regulator [Bacillus thuringiensis]|uniref:helix-turn-helix transcriptional regulator n=1 Tax=Bacillus thuringiensis TaxID=1428 RepID=UPI003339FC09
MDKVQKENTRMYLKYLRKQKGTQRQVALDIGVTETTLRNLENGHSKPSLELAFALAVYFNARMESLWPDLVESSKKRICNL